MAATRARTGARFRSFPARESNYAGDAAAQELEPDAAVLSSYCVPALAAGTYTARFVQSITAPDGKADTLSSKQQFAVRVPQLQLDPNVDVHLVFPAPGNGS